VFDGHSKNVRKVNEVYYSLTVKRILILGV
jgi:hypothetical protein